MRLYDMGMTILLAAGIAAALAIIVAAQMS